HYTIGAQALSNRGHHAAPLPLARSRYLPSPKNHGRPQHLLWCNPQNTSGHFHRARERRVAADSGTVREGVAGTISGHFPRESPVDYRAVRWAAGPDTIFALRRGCFASGDRVRERVDPAPGAWRAAAT